MPQVPQPPSGSPASGASTPPPPPPPTSASPPPPPTAAQLATLSAAAQRPRATVEIPADLRELLPEVHRRQEQMIRQRRRLVGAIGLGLSIALHMVLLGWLAMHFRAGGGGEGPVEVSVAIEAMDGTSTDLTDLASDTVDTLGAEASELPDPTSADLQAVLPDGDLVVANGAPSPAFAGAGNAGAAVGGGIGGGAGTSFFGIRSTGNRFAYIVDRSGSMNQDRRWTVARDELLRSIRALPAEARVHVVLFSLGSFRPPFQEDWLPARRSSVRRLEDWLSTQAPNGGTEPADAFDTVFDLKDRPDVIFFLTDGEIPQGIPDQVLELNERGRPVVINTIAFGDPSSQVMLQRIAQESGGKYIYRESRIGVTP
ncbi:MAG: VWA domain-containing protein [Phycisphaerales bacterium]